MTFNKFPLSKLFSFLRGRGLKADVKRSSTPGIGPVKLSQMLVVLGQNAETGKGLRLMATDIDADKLVFKTGAAVEEGQLLYLEMLLQGHGTFKATATVERVEQSARSFSGELSIATTPEQHEVLRKFAMRQQLLSR